MAPGELLSVDDHLAVCEACRERLFAVEQLDAEARLLCADLQVEEAAAHLSYDLLAAYADSRLDEFDRVIVDSHLEVCPSCAEEAEDLLEFSRRLKSAPTPTRPADPPPLWARDSDFRGRPVWWTTLRAAAAGAFLCLCVLAAVFLSRPTPDPASQNLLATGVEAERAGEYLAPPNPSAEPPPIPAGAPSLPDGGGRRHKPSSDADSPTKSSPRKSESLSPGQAALILRDGGQQVTLNHRGEFQGLDRLPPRLRQSLRAALLRREVSKPAVIEELYGGPITLLGDPVVNNPLTLMSPVGTVVLSNRPTFRWSSLNGAEGYTVEVYDPALKRVAVSSTITATQWTVEEPLRRGVVYRWQVIALKDGDTIRAPKPPAPEAKFKVLEEQKAVALNGIDKLSPDSHLTRGVLYALEGLADDAERELQALVNDNPNSDAAKGMLRSVRAWRQ